MVKVYTFAISFYAAQSILLAATHDARRWHEMALHHVLAMALLLASLTGGYMHTGVVVLLLHSAFEPAFQCARILFLIGLRKAARPVLAVAFVLFVGTRLIALPLVIVLQMVQGTHGAQLAWRGHVCVALLAMLSVLHLLWARAICRILLDFRRAARRFI